MNKTSKNRLEEIAFRGAQCDAVEAREMARQLLTSALTEDRPRLGMDVEQAWEFQNGRIGGLIELLTEKDARLAELEAVEKTSEAREQRLIRVHKMFQRQRDRAVAAEKRIEELRDWNFGLAQESFTYQQRVAELEALVEALESAQRKIAEQDQQLITYASVATKNAERAAELEAQTYIPQPLDIEDEYQNYEYVAGWNDCRNAAACRFERIDRSSGIKCEVKGE